MSNLAKYTTKSYSRNYTLYLRTKCSIFIKVMNLCTHPGREWSLEAETKHEIEG